MSDRDPRTPVLLPSGVEHGAGAYDNHRCGCPVCREGNRRRHAGARSRRARTLAPDDPRHGRDYTYSNWGCDCPPCREAHRQRVAAYRARQKEAAP